MRIRTFLADDHALVRAGIRSLLEREPDISVIAEASDGREAVRLVRLHRPDLAVLDIGMPSLNGIEATRQIVADRLAPVLILSMHSDVQFVAGAFGAGALGYLLKGAAEEELVAAVRAVAGGRTFLSSEVADVVLGDYVRHLSGDAPPVEPQLSGREREVVQLIAEGHTSKEIAGILHISVKTAENHRARIMAKLGLRSVAALTKYAIRRGLTDLES